MQGGLEHQANLLNLHPTVTRIIHQNALLYAISRRKNSQFSGQGLNFPRSYPVNMPNLTLIPHLKVGYTPAAKTLATPRLSFRILSELSAFQVSCKNVLYKFNVIIIIIFRYSIEYFPKTIRITLCPSLPDLVGRLSVRSSGG